MKKHLLALALIAAAGGAHAGSAIIDSFDFGNQLIELDAANPSITLTNSYRTLNSTLLASVGSVGSTAEVNYGFLDIANAGGEDSTVTVQWNVGALAIPTGATDIGFLFKILESDGNPADVTFSLDGTQIFASAIPGRTSMADITFTLANPSLITSGGLLELAINGATGWDLSLDAIGISWTDPVVTPPAPPAPIPEPTSMALMGLGALGLAAVRRRK